MSLRPSPLYRALACRQFLIAAGILLVAVVAFEGTLQALGQVLSKKPVPLLRSLAEVPESFGTRFVLARELDDPANDLNHGKVHVPPDIEEILGTKDHITWLYKDVSRSTGSSLAYVRLHIAYYPRMLDVVPHVADICMLAAGHDLDTTLPATLLSWPVDLPEPWKQWRRASLERTAFIKRDAAGLAAQRSVVYHVFSVNGNPVNHRLEVSRLLSDPRRTYCYYAKIELSAGRVGQALSVEDSDEICRAFWTAAAEPILTRHMPSAQDVEKLELTK